MGHGRAVVTALPAHPTDPPVSIAAQQLKLKVNGKDATVTGWTQLRESNSPVELVLLIDGSARTNLGGQFSAITGFVNEIPTNTKIAIAYMEEGRAAMAGPLSSDPAQVLQGLRMPAGMAGSNGSPYFRLSDLAKNWPSRDGMARREVVMITDGVDNTIRATILMTPMCSRRSRMQCMRVGGVCTVLARSGRHGQDRRGTERGPEPAGRGDRGNRRDRLLGGDGQPGFV